MKKFFALFLLGGFVFFSSPVIMAQDEDAEAIEAPAEAEEAPETAPAETTPPPPPAADNNEDEESAGFRETLKRYYIEGGWIFMTFVLICLILGLALCIERIITLNLNTTDANRLMSDVSSKLQSGDTEGAKSLLRGSRGPVASIAYQGLTRAGDGPDMVEKAMVSYAGVEMAKLEKGLTWIALFIAIAPMLGFMGTVIGMIEAFDEIERAGDISPSIVAGGIKVALLTTVFGLIVAIILQVFYNYIISKVDGLVGDMEEATITTIDSLKS